MPMTVSKTREMLVDVARQLFARMGVDNTTMNDIAQASKKGRRTLYTYFKSKNEIYLAVVESELDQLYKMLQDVARKTCRRTKSCGHFFMQDWMQSRRWCSVTGH